MLDYFVLIEDRRDGHNTPRVFSLAGPTPSPAVIGTPAVGGSVVNATEGAADSTSSLDIRQAAGTDGLSTPASYTGLSSTTPAQAEHPAETFTAATAADVEQAHKAGANADAQEATSTAGVDSSSEAAASGPVDADSPADSSHKVDGEEPGQAGQSDKAAAGAVSDHASVAVESAEAAEGLAAVADAEEAEATALNTHDASGPSAQAPVHKQQAAQDWPELSCKQAFAAIHFATGTVVLVGRCCSCWSVWTVQSRRASGAKPQCMDMQLRTESVLSLIVASVNVPHAISTIA